jgi:hypothetical protein
MSSEVGGTGLEPGTSTAVEVRTNQLDRRPYLHPIFNERFLMLIKDLKKDG